ncbi:Transcriptional activator Myb [Tolypocladium ophioglossoides CBS 100239]|uniref:Transcriptional activator Myb n=1 Tax=Tolypocladium ophioglossoides (strain CBS 100239) TaxID=1163406 RepID=A0A0L0N5M4_TOLOC|nr:Transcriptional activator Myb [Tolypocladium ophioglossoides CBS 100239]
MDWNRVAASLPGRTNKDCRKRWVNRLCGERKMGPWDREEDKLLLEAIGNYGPRWTVIASHVGSRSPDQCAKRWQFKLDPKLDRGRWSTTEDQLLLKSVAEYGREWKRIQDDRYPGRSRNDLKNRYTILTRRSNTESRTRVASDPRRHVVDVVVEEAEDSPRAESSSTDNHEVLELGTSSVMGGDDGGLGMQLGDDETGFGFGMDMDGCGDHWLDAMCQSPGSVDFTDIAVDFDLLQSSSSAAGFSPPPALASFSASQSQSPGVASIVSAEDLDPQMAQYSQQHDMDAANLFQRPLFPQSHIRTRPRGASRELSAADMGLGDVLEQQLPAVRRSKVALVVEACDGPMLNRLLAVARMADGNAKVEIEYVT